VHLGQVEDARAEGDPLGARDERGQEDQRRGDGLAQGGEMLAHEGLGEAEAVRQHDGLLILGEDGPVIPVVWVERHHEHPELDGHRRLLPLSRE
jgi:hypothetical protein